MTVEMAMELSLSQEELCFAILTESHADVSTSLFEFVLNAVKAIHPTDWKETICSCLGAAVGRYVRQRLENDLPVTDFYALCRIIRCRINDVIKFIGGNTLNPREKERFCLHIEGVEVARHWAFHGDQYVSVGEVRSSIALLRSVLITLSCRSEKMKVLAEDLSMLLEYAERLGNSKKKWQYHLRADSIRCALLHNSLSELEGNYGELLCGNGDSGSLNQNETTDNFPSSLSLMKKAIQERQTLQKHFGSNQKKIDYMKMYKNILAVRNTLAHNAPLTGSRVKKALGDIKNLLCAFDLSCIKTTSAKESLAVVISKEGQREKTCCCVSKGDNDAAKEASRERFLRGRGQYFVGRESETLSIKSALCKELSEGIRVVLLFGTAGVGKSYLATNVAHDLVNIYSKQMWLSCSDSRELCHSQYNNCDFKNEHVVSHVQPKVFHHFKMAHGESFSKCKRNRLIVFDDVCSSTMHLVHKRIHTLRSDSCALLTTRSTTVKQFFQQVLPYLHVIHLRPFSLSESWSLLERNLKTKMADIHEETRIVIGRTLSRALGHLPLCVSIYSSLLKSNLRKNGHTSEGELQSSYAFKTWKVIETNFGDLFHVRGLTGIVECAAINLQDSPLVVFLLAKIAIADTERIPWIVLAKPVPQWVRKYSWHHVNTTLTGPDQVLSRLLGVVDCLFSDCCQATLEICRNTLEELGLISWEESSSTVCIHKLSLESVSDMLERKALFLNNLFLYTFCDSGKATSLTARASRALCCELRIQTLGTCVDVLRDETVSKARECAQEVAFSVFEFLSKYVERGMPVIQTDIPWYRFMGCLKSIFVETLQNFSSHFRLSVSYEEQISWLQVYMQFPLSKSGLQNLALATQWEEATHQIVQGMPGQAMSIADLLISTCSSHWGHCGANSHFVAFIHCVQACLIGLERGSLARKMYLKFASCTCPRLLIEPTCNDVHFAILNSLEAPTYSSACECLHHEQIFLWHLLVRFKIQDCGLVDGQIRTMFLLLVILYQQRQRLVLEEINNDSTAGEILTSEKVQLFSFLIDEAIDEALLWDAVPKHGRSLRVLVKTYFVIDNFLKNHISTMLTKNQKVTESFLRHLMRLMSTLWCFVEKFGHSLAVLTLFKTLLTLSQKTNIVHCISDHGQWCRSVDRSDYIECDVFHELCVPILVLHEVQSLYERMDFEEGLGRLLSILKQSLSANCSRTHIALVLFWHLQAVSYVGGLCVLLGRPRSTDAVKQLVLLSECSSVPSRIKAILKNVVSQIKSNWEQTEHFSIYDSFTQSRKDVAAGNMKRALKQSLKFWMEADYFLERLWENEKELTTTKSDMFEVLTHTICIMICEVARILQQLYAEEGKCAIGEWFLKFRIQRTKQAKLFLFEARYVVEYIKFLKECRRYDEALEHCQTVERDLEEELGDDYPEWLPDMPNVATMRKELEQNTDQQTIL